VNELKKLRIQAGVSQRDVADQLGYSTPQFISNWERGVSCPPYKSIKKLSVMYKTSVENLVRIVDTIREQNFREQTARLKKESRL